MSGKQPSTQEPTIFFEKCHAHSIFITNSRQLIVISFNLNLPLKLFFCQRVITNNNLSLTICCKNVIKIFLISMASKIITKIVTQKWYL